LQSPPCSAHPAGDDVGLRLKGRALVGLRPPPTSGSASAEGSPALTVYWWMMAPVFPEQSECG